jgi:hypothetical protein
MMVGEPAMKRVAVVFLAAGLSLFCCQSSIDKDVLVITGSMRIEMKPRHCGHRMMSMGDRMVDWPCPLENWAVMQHDGKEIWARWPQEVPSRPGEVGPYRVTLRIDKDAKYGTVNYRIVRIERERQNVWASSDAVPP